MASKSFGWCITFLATLKSVEGTFAPWPMPSSYSKGDSTISLSSDFQFTLIGDAATSTILQSAITRYDSLINIDSTGSVTGLDSCSIQVNEIVDDEIASLNMLYVNESYTLNADSSSCIIESQTIWGAIHGLEMFTQNLQRISNDNNILLPTFMNLPLFVSDSPRFTHRGMMIDTSRHYLSVSFIKHIIDSLSYDKFNVLHWHMVDAQSFPVDSTNEASDMLSQGAYASDLIYTLENINDIVNYAAERGIRIVLEIDVPGHAASWGAGYPDIMADCEVKYSYNINDFALNPTIDDTYTVLGGLLGDLYTSLQESTSTNTFSPVTIHLGGDEVVYGCWKNDSSITAWMAQNNVNSYDDLLAYFISNAQTLTSNIGFESTSQWEEVFTSGLSDSLNPNTIYQVWQYTDNIKAITGSNLRTIASPNGYWYLDQTTSTWDVMYDYDPSTDLTEGELSYLIGGETAMWGEHVDEYNFDQVVHMRAEAVAERLWSTSQEGVTSTNDATVFDRLLEHRCRLLNRGVMSMPLQPGYCEYNWI